MKNLITSYSFNANAKEITISIVDFIAEVERVCKIVNLTNNFVIYDVNNNFGGVFPLNDVTCNTNKIVFQSDNSGMQNTDKILIEYDFFFDLEKAMKDYLDKNGYSKKNNQIINDVVVGNTLTETTIYSFIVKANEFKVNENILPNLFGRFSKNNTSQIQIRIKLNNVTVSTITTNTNNETNIPFDINVISTLRIEGILGELQSFLRMVIDNVTNDADATNLIPFNTTIDNTIRITAQWTGLNEANTFTLSQAYTEQ